MEAVSSYDGVMRDCNIPPLPLNVRQIKASALFSEVHL